MNNKNEIELKAQLTTDELVGHLHALADSIASRRVVIEHGARVVQLEPSDRAEFEIEAEQKQGKSKLSVSISWHAPRAMGTQEILKISSQMPERSPADLNNPGE